MLFLDFDAPPIPKHFQISTVYDDDDDQMIIAIETKSWVGLDFCLHWRCSQPQSILGQFVSYLSGKSGPKYTINELQKAQGEQL